MYYFAYGSNMDIQRLRGRKVKPLSCQSARIEDYKLVFNKKADAGGGEGFANIVSSPGEVVEGVLYEVEERDLDKLDICEGVKDGHYMRMPVTASPKSGDQIDAIVYVAQHGKVVEGLKPRKRYLDYLLAGKEYLSEEYYLFLKNIKILD